MRATLLAFTLIALGTAQAGTAQELALPGNQITMDWASNDSAYAAVARHFDTEFPNRTKLQPAFAPQVLSSEIGENLESRLNASLERQLAKKEQKAELKVGAN